MSNIDKQIVELLSAKVPKEYIEEKVMPGRPKLSYIPIDKMVLMLNHRVGDHWSVENLKMEPIPGNTPGFYCTLDLTVNHSERNDKGEIIKNTYMCRSGVGASIYKSRDGKAPVDPDMLVKTAYAQALKSAANRYGLGLELWDESNLDTDEPGNSAPEKKAEVKQPVEPAQTGPTALNDDSKKLVAEFCQKTNLTKSELSDFLKVIHPESNGIPTFLATADPNLEKQQVVAFLDAVEKKLNK
jgi:hypothetical protein